MARNPALSRARELPAQASLEHLKNEAKQRLKALRQGDPGIRLAALQLAVARDYGFASWRQLRAHVDGTSRKPVFAAARTGDFETVRRAFDAGFDPNATDDDGRTIHQIAKAERHEAIELLSRDLIGLATQPPKVQQAIDAILDATAKGRIDELRRLLDAHPKLIDARGGGFDKQTALHLAAATNRTDCARLLLARGADVRVRDFPNNATPLHFAAIAADLELVRLLVEAGADTVGAGDDFEVGVLGWATRLHRLREDVAAYLLAHGAKLDLWSAIALDRIDHVRSFVARDRSLLDALMTRNPAPPDAAPPRRGEEPCADGQAVARTRRRSERDGCDRRNASDHGGTGKCRSRPRRVAGGSRRPARFHRGAESEALRRRRGDAARGCPAHRAPTDAIRSRSTSRSAARTWRRSVG